MKNAPGATVEEWNKALKYVAENSKVFEAVIEQLKGKRPEVEDMEEDLFPLYPWEKAHQQSSQGPQGLKADARRGSVRAPTVESVPLPRQRLSVRPRSFKSVPQEVEDRHRLRSQKESLGKST